MNFNNILSSESISPKAFYQKRSFGYGRWVTIPQNPLENSIVLYDELCFFNRPASDVEDHPLLIEIVLDDAIESTLLRCDDHIYLSDHTIFIDPFSTNLLFFTENDKTVALSLSDSSVETKFAHFYRNRICVITPPANEYPLIDASSEKQVFDDAEVEKDKRTNRMKGLLYGYYIGGILSAHKEDVVRLNTLREIHDILAAILASFDHQATERQRDRLRHLYSRIQPEIPFFSKLKGLIPENEPLFDAFVSLVREIYGYIPGEFNVDSIITNLLATSTGKGAQNPVVEKNNYLINQTESAIRQRSRPIPSEDEQIVVKNGKLVQIKNLSKADKVLYMAWINDVLSKDEYTGKTSTFKNTLSDDITIKSKEVYNGEWKGSYPEITLNALRRHTRGENFEHKWGNDIFSSVSALILRGDDWTKLLQFMQSKEMTDYRIAFSMYGTINGLANLPRDFTDILLNQDKKYVADVAYKEFYRQLFGRDITKTKCENRNVQSPANNIPSAQLPESALLNEFDSMMGEIYRLCSGARKDESTYRGLFMQYRGLTEEFIAAVNQESTLNNGKGVQKTISKYLSGRLNPKKRIKRQKGTEATLFSMEEQSTGKFLTDYVFLVNNCEFSCMMNSVNKEWETDLRWFIDAHSPNHKDHHYYQNKPTDNQTLINQFVGLKNGKYRLVERFLKKTYLG